MPAPRRAVSEPPLHEDEVEPAAELEADFLQVAGLLETEALVHPDRAAVVGVDPRHHHVLAERAAAGDQHVHQRRADAVAAAAVGHVHGVLDGEAIAGPGAEVAEGGEAGHWRVVQTRDQQGIAVPLPRLVPDLNPEIQPIIERALKKNVDERFPDAESFRVAVSRVRKRFEDDTAQVAPTVLIRETPAPTRKTGSSPVRRPSTDAVSVATPPPTDRDALARRRLAQLEAALGQGRTLLAAGDLEMALDFCQQALTFDEHHAGALELEQEIAAA